MVVHVQSDHSDITRSHTVTFSIILRKLTLHSKSTSPIQSLYQTLRFVQGMGLHQYVGALNTARENGYLDSLASVKIQGGGLNSVLYECIM